jgi:hypothetical protein
MVDISVRDPSAPSVVARAAVDGAAASAKASGDKERVYGADAKRLGYNLVTFAMDTTGALGSEAKAFEFVDKLCRVYESSEVMPDPLFRGRILMELSAALQRGECRVRICRFGVRTGV